MFAWPLCHEQGKLRFQLLLLLVVLVVVVVVVVLLLLLIGTFGEEKCLDLSLKEERVAEL